MTFYFPTECLKMPLMNRVQNEFSFPRTFFSLDFFKRVNEGVEGTRRVINFFICCCWVINFSSFNSFSAKVSLNKRMWSCRASVLIIQSTLRLYSLWYLVMRRSNSSGKMIDSMKKDQTEEKILLPVNCSKACVFSSSNWRRTSCSWRRTWRKWNEIEEQKLSNAHCWRWRSIVYLLKSIVLEVFSLEHQKQFSLLIELIYSDSILLRDIF